MMMIKVLAKTVGGALLLALLGISGTLGYFLLVLPQDVPVPDITIERTPARVARGEYLANAVFSCMYCHSERDWTLFSGQIKPGTLGKGGEVFDRRMGLSGKVVSPNLTPYNLGTWTDGEIYRAITSGLHKDGYAYFPLMPWDAYIWMRTEDVYAIIAYLRTLPPIKADHEPRQPSLLMRVIANMRVRPAEPFEVNFANPVSRGEYLTVVAGCRFCHTTRAPRDWRRMNQENLAGHYGGGAVIAGHGKPLPAANISPDKETGIGNWTVEQFITRFKAYEGARIPVGPDGANTEHAWTDYAQMTESDLADIYAYLMTQTPKRNRVAGLE